MRKIDEYMKLPYTRLIKEINDANGHYFVGSILELDGCMSDATTLEELHTNLDEVMEMFFQTAIELDWNIPEPVQVDDYSGKFNLRIPKSLHQRLVIEAKKEGVSLNQYALYKLSL